MRHRVNGNGAIIKCFGPNIRASDVRECAWDSSTSIQGFPVQSAITSINEENPTKLLVKGYAISGVCSGISADGGRTRQQAHQERAHNARKWAWTLWSLSLPKSDLSRTGKEAPVLAVKAVDEAYDTQPENFDSIWNFRVSWEIHGRRSWYSSLSHRRDPHVDIKIVRKIKVEGSARSRYLV